jgi:hypothetical protein
LGTAESASTPWPGGSPLEVQMRTADFSSCVVLQSSAV